MMVLRLEEHEVPGEECFWLREQWAQSVKAFRGNWHRSLKEQNGRQMPGLLCVWGEREEQRSGVKLQ